MSVRVRNVVEPAEVLSKKLNADVVLFNHRIDPEAADSLHKRLDDIAYKHSNVFFMLVTNGGDAHAGYIIARDLQLRYDHVTVCIAGDCYSAGTLIALCANDIVITNRGRLGPLDVQLPKRDELLEKLSGLTAGIALAELHRRAAEALVSVALELKRSTAWQISFKTALDLAGDMTAKMFGEIYKQIDPMRLGEDAMALAIAEHYGTILGKKSSNLKPGAVERLLEQYPSHQCIIDKEEAGELFQHLREPSREELALLDFLGQAATDASEGRSNPNLIYAFPTSKQTGAPNEPEAEPTARNGRSATKSKGEHRNTASETSVVRRNGTARSVNPAKSSR